MPPGRRDKLSRPVLGEDRRDLPIARELTLRHGRSPFGNGRTLLIGQPHRLILLASQKQYGPGDLVLRLSGKAASDRDGAVEKLGHGRRCGRGRGV